jgi:RNA polymerase sigma-70 factor (ECF subfamily)
MNFPATLSASDNEILELLQHGGINRRKGEERLFNAYSYFIREGIQNHGLQEDESFNAYADAVLSVINNIINHSFEGRSSVKTYLFQVFSNKCVDQLRKKTTNRYSVHLTVSISEKLNYISDSGKTVVQKLVEQTDWNMLKQKLNELGENCRQMLMLSAEGNTDKEIAAIMDYKTPDVVKTSRLRCLEKLRQLYKQAQ